MENRKTGRYILNNSVRKWIGLALYGAAAAAAVYFFLAIQIRVWNSSGQNYCMLDCMHALEGAENFGIFYLLLTISMIVADRKAYTYPSFVLQYKDTNRIWNVLCAEVLKKSVLYSVIYSNIICLFSAMASTQISNWDVKRSLFYKINKSFYTDSVVYVILAFFLFNMMKTFLSVGLLILFDSWFDGMLWGYFLLLCPVVLEWKGIGMDWNIFFNLFSISHQNFYSLLRAACILVFGCMLMGAVYWSGRKIWKEKEFYGRENDVRK